MDQYIMLSKNNIYLPKFDWKKLKVDKNNRVYISDHIKEDYNN